MDVFILILELIGAAAFAVSGAMTGIRKNMDIFGACVLGLTVAVGGGITRDIILGAFPPAMFHDPIYAITAILTCFIVFIPRIRDFLEGNSILMLLSASLPYRAQRAPLPSPQRRMCFLRSLSASSQVSVVVCSET